jgi:DNA ligase-1
MPEIEEGESVEIQGSSKDPYILKNTGGVYSCSCPAWRTQSHPIEKRTCKHLRKYRGDALEIERLGGELPARAASTRRKTTTASSASSPDAGDSDLPTLLLAHSWDNSADLTGWWMSEKLDGVRAYWDGRKLISRQGNVYMAPDWFIEDLPADVHLDGELWIARKMFQRTVSIVRRQDKSKEWEEVKFLVFDAPRIDDVFEARIAYIQQLLDETQPRYAAPHVQERCMSVEHLLAELKRVESLGGEGLMLRQPNSKYEVGRSNTLLKVKTFHDAEARVLEYLPGTGKHKGKMGALSVELKDGTKFAIGTGFSDRERANPPSIGSIVTFRYQELTDRGVPRFPSFVRVRTDIDSLPDSALVDTTGGTVVISPDESQGGGSDPPLETKPAASAEVGSAAKTVSSNVITFAPRGSTPSMGAPAAPDESIPRYFEFVEGSSSKFWTIWRDGADVTVQFGKLGTSGQEKTKSLGTVEKAKAYYSDIIEEKTGKGYLEKTGPGGELLDSGDACEDENQDFEGRSGDNDSADEDDAFVDHSRRFSGSLPHGNQLQLFRRNLVGSCSCYCSECYPQLKSQAKTPDRDESSDTTPLTSLKTSASSGRSSVSGNGGSASTASNAAKSATSVATVATGVRYFEFKEGSSSKFWSIAISGNDVTVKYGRIGTNGQEKTKTFTNPLAAQEYYDEIVEEKLGKGYEETAH